MPPTEGVKVNLGGREVRLRYTTYSEDVAEQQYGKSVVALMIQAGRGSTSSLITLVWAGLLEDNRELNRDDVRDFIELDRFEEIAGAIKEAVHLAHGITDDEKKKEPEGKEVLTEA